jgi:hypothetical protein
METVTCVIWPLKPGDRWRFGAKDAKVQIAIACKVVRSGTDMRLFLCVWLSAKGCRNLRSTKRDVIIIMASRTYFRRALLHQLGAEHCSAMYEADVRHRLHLCAPRNPLLACHNVPNVPVNRIKLDLYFSCHYDCRKICCFKSLFLLLILVFLCLCSAVCTCAPVLYDKPYLRCLCNFTDYVIAYVY